MLRTAEEGIDEVKADGGLHHITSGRKRWGAAVGSLLETMNKTKQTNQPNSCSHLATLKKSFLVQSFETPNFSKGKTNTYVLFLVSLS